MAALSTLVLEDPTTIGCGLLVAEHRMTFLTALVGLTFGIAAGDVGLYGLGRALGPQVTQRGMVAPHRLERATRWFHRNLIVAVLLSRFVPGMRLPTYVGAGVLRAPVGRFIAVVVGASLAWTYLLLRITIAVGERVLPLLGGLRWPVAGLALLALVVVQRRVSRAATRSSSNERTLSFFELWPPWLFYIPVVLHWLWLSLRYRSLTLPTAANPSIYSGGFIGESKSAILDLVPEGLDRWIAAYTVLDRGGEDVSATAALGRARAALAEAKLVYPLVAKPDVGQRGDGVQPIRDDAELLAYLGSFPNDSRLLLQELVGHTGDKVGQPEIPVDRGQPPTGTSGPAEDPQRKEPEERPTWWSGVREAGVLYWRLPGAERGQVFSITFKLFPEVVGDGQRTVRALIGADPRARRLLDTYLGRRDDADRVPRAGERVPLVFAGNHCQGAIFKDGTPYLTPKLSNRIHEIARALPGFHFGRFDLRCNDADTLLRGEGFKIVEINGASAEATHIWDASASLAGAYATLFEQSRILFAIGAANRRRGHRPLGALQLLGDARAYRRTARTYPESR